MGNEQISEIRQRLLDALDLLADLESGQAPKQKHGDVSSVGGLAKMFMDFGMLSSSAIRNAKTYSHLDEAYVARAMAWVRATYPTDTQDAKCARLIACLRDRYTLQAVPDEDKEKAAHEARLEELRAKREAKEKARQMG